MKSLQDIIQESLLQESVKNLFDSDKDKLKYVDQVWNILQEAYKSQGGIHGSGFKSKSDMIKNIPMWKLDVVDGKVLVVVMYKFKSRHENESFRKLVAVGLSNDNRNLARTKLKNIMKMEFSRSILEVSGLMHDWLKRNYPDLLKSYAIPVTDAQKILVNDTLIALDDFAYQRKIGGSMHTKYMYGTLTRRR